MNSRFSRRGPIPDQSQTSDLLREAGKGDGEAASRLLPMLLTQNK